MALKSYAIRLSENIKKQRPSPISWGQTMRHWKEVEVEVGEGSE